MLLGCIADDFTGASDLANTLTAAGMRTVQTIGVPPEAGGAGRATPSWSRSSRAASSRREAVRQSLGALAWLQAHGRDADPLQVLLDVRLDARGQHRPGRRRRCSIELDAPITIACPAFPANRRTIFMGHLFVGERLLSESGMQHHPLTPMTDAEPGALAAAADAAARSALLDHATVVARRRRQCASGSRSWPRTA